MSLAARARHVGPGPGRRRKVPTVKLRVRRRPRTALQKHVDFFDTDGDGRITLAETYRGLRRLGLGSLRSAVAAVVINVALGSSTSGGPSLSVDTERIQVGLHASDTGVYDTGGAFSEARFDALFTRYDEIGDGALDAAGLARMFADQRTDWLGHLGSRAEFGLLLELAGKYRDGRRVLTRERLLSFYDGSLFAQLAEEVAARRDDEPSAQPPRRRATPASRLNTRSGRRGAAGQARRTTFKARSLAALPKVS